MKTSLFNIERLNSLTKKFIKLKIIALYGPLGAGKTTFTKYLAKNLRVEDEVTSPTFTIINNYQTSDGKDVYHIDCYRLKATDQTDLAQIAEILSDPTNIVIIEWPELIEHLLPEDTLRLKFEIINQDTRKIFEI